MKRLIETLINHVDRVFHVPEEDETLVVLLRLVLFRSFLFFLFLYAALTENLAFER